MRCLLLRGQPAAEPGLASTSRERSKVPLMDTCNMTSLAASPAPQLRRKEHELGAAVGGKLQVVLV